MKERSDASFIWGVKVSLMCVTDGLGRNIQVVLVKKKGSKQAEAVASPCLHCVECLPELEDQNSHRPPHFQKEWAYFPDCGSSQVQIKGKPIQAKQALFQRSGESLQAARLLD